MVGVMPAGGIPANARRALTAISMLGAATFLAAGLGFATQTLLARELGPTAYGLFSSSLVTVMMIAPLAGFGLTQFRLKAYGVEGWAAHRWLKPSLRFTMFSTLLAMGLIAAWALIVAPANGTRFTLLVLIPVVLCVLATDLVSNKLRLEDRYHFMALWQLMIPGSRFVVAVALLLLPHLTYRFVAVGYSVIAVLVTLRAWPQLRQLMRDEIELKGHGKRAAARPAMPSETPRVRELWSEAWAYGVVSALYPVFFQVSTVLLKYLTGDTQAGLYGIAIFVLSAIYLIPITIYQKFLLAKLHRWAAHDQPKFWRVYRLGTIGMLALGLSIGIVLAATAPWLVPIVFGAEYRPVVTILMVLSPCIPLRYLYVAMGSVLQTADHTRYRVYAMALAAGVVIALDLLLIPPFKALGAAGATVVGECVLLLVTWYCVRRFVKPGQAVTPIMTSN